MKLRLRGPVVLFLIALLAIPGIYLGLTLKEKESRQRAASAAAALARASAPDSPRSPVPEEGDAGDVVLGRSLFDVHCASCHGFGGDGRGPSASAVRLVPPPARLGDATLLASASDERLSRAIAEGGAGIGRSRLMPAFADRFDALEIAAIVAYLRSTALSVRDVVPDARDVAARETVLDDGRAVAYFDVLPDGGGAPLARVLFVGELAVAASSSTETEGELLRARTLGGADPAPAEVDAALRTLSAAVARRAEDEREARRLREAFAEDPSAFPLGARLFVEGCAACHGPAGRPVESEAAQATHRPALLADGERQARLTDDRLKELIRRGGAALRISEAMPSYGGVYSEGEIEAIVEHVRTLAVPRRNGAGDDGDDETNRRNP